MNKIFQERLLKLVSIVNVDAVFRSINDKKILKAQKKDWSQTVPQTYQRDKPSNSFNSTFFQFSKHIVSVDILIYIFQMLLMMRIDYILLIKF